MPDHYWHSFKAVGDERAPLIYFTTALCNYIDLDEERMPWDDPRVTPSLINGKTYDPHGVTCPGTGGIARLNR